MNTDKLPEHCFFIRISESMHKISTSKPYYSNEHDTAISLRYKQNLSTPFTEETAQHIINILPEATQIQFQILTSAQSAKRYRRDLANLKECGELNMFIIFDEIVGIEFLDSIVDQTNAIVKQVPIK